MYILRAIRDTPVYKPYRPDQPEHIDLAYAVKQNDIVKCSQLRDGRAQIDINGRTRSVQIADFEILAPLTWEESLNRIETVGVSQVYADEYDAKLIGLKDGSILKISSESESCAACGNCQSNRVPSIRIKLPNVEGWH